MPYLLENVGVLDALCSRAQEQLEAQREAAGWLGRPAAVAVPVRGAADGGSGGGGGDSLPGEGLRQEEQWQGQEQAPPPACLHGSGHRRSRAPGMDASTWSVSTDAITPEQSAGSEQHPPLHAWRAAGAGDAERAAPAGAAPAAEEAALPAARGTDAEAAATRGGRREVWGCSAELAGCYPLLAPQLPGWHIASSAGAKPLPSLHPSTAPMPLRRRDVPAAAGGHHPAGWARGADAPRRGRCQPGAVGRNAERWPAA